MLGGVYSPGEVAEFTTRVSVNGVDRPVVSVSLDASWGSDLPSEISPSSSGMSRGGTIEWAGQEDVQGRPVTAFRDWGEWRPRRGDSVTVYVGDGVSEWPRFTGLVDETTGGVGERMSSSIISDVDRLSEPFECEALLERMPPVYGSNVWRDAGLSPIYLADQAMRAGGYYATPKCPAYEVLDVPLQTSILPRVGEAEQLFVGSSYDGTQSYLSNHGAPWGYTGANFKAQYRPRYDDSANRAIIMGFNFTESHIGVADIKVRYGNDYYRLFLNEARRATVQVMRSGVLTESCRIDNVNLAGASRIEAMFKGGIVTLRANNGAQATGSTPAMASTLKNRIDVEATPDARMAGVLVYHPESWSEFQSLNAEPTAIIDSRTGGATTWGTINSTPRFESQTAMEAVETLAAATLSAIWIDEEGVLHFAPSGAVRGAPSQQTITTKNDVLALSWSDKLIAAARRVTIAYKYASFKAGGGIPQVELARGSQQSLTSGTVVEDIYAPAEDEDWYGVDLGVTKLGAVDWSAYNADDGTFVGVTYYKSNDPEPGVSSSLVTITLEKTGLSEYTVTHTAGTLPSGVTAETTTHPTWTGLWDRHRNKGLPLIQGWGKITWIDRETTRQTTALGPALTVDVGAFARVTKAQDARDYLVDFIENAIPQMSGLDVIPDPRRQIGDIITLESDGFLGVTITGVITSINEGVDSGGYTQTLDVEPRSLTTGALTYGEWEAAFPGTLTYSQWESMRGPTDTYQTFEDDPLKGAV